jgi:thiol-disulfide isomerase/thioredoxin
MKKQLLIITALFISMLSFSQGIVFEKGTWKQVLAKAKLANKPIFVDVSTSWCKPCKIMSKEIFPLAEVGKVYNANYVCYQIDAEKGEGIAFTKKYEVKAYPTYMFITPNETLFSMALGSMSEKKFIDVSKMAMAEMNDPKPMVVWNKEYLTKKNDPVFLLDYMNKREKLGQSNITLFDEYLKALPEDERISLAIIKMYTKEKQGLKVNSYAFENLFKNRAKFISKNIVSVDDFITYAISKSANEAARTKNKKLFSTVLSLFDQLPKEVVKSSKDLTCINYYSSIGDLVNLAKAANTYYNNYLTKTSFDSINKIDKLKLQEFENQLKSGSQINMDSAQIANLKASIKNNEFNKFINNINVIARIIIRKISDVKVLQDALRWSNYTLEIYPNNGSYMETNANLLYKLGRKDEAIAKLETAIHYYTEVEKGDTNGFKDLIAKIKAGEKTW